MPELPDVEVYCDALNRYYAGRSIRRVGLRSPFVVRTVTPDLFAVEGKRIVGFRRLGKRIVWQLEGDLFLVLHLMIAGRLHRKKPGARPRAKTDLAAFHFSQEDGDADTLMLTEASPKKRASIHLVEHTDSLTDHDPGGLEPLQCTLDEFSSRLKRKNHTLKRCLTSPEVFSGLGNAYSDEILHAARLSPIVWSQKLSDEEVERLFIAVQSTLSEWINRLLEQTGDQFPEKVTAFHPEMAAHGRFGQPCPVCNAAIQRIRYADRETNYCARCQTGGKVLADRSLSRLLKGDWPRTLEED